MQQLSDQEIADLLNAIQTQQNEICVGDGFPEGTAFDQRLNAIATKLKAELDDRKPIDWDRVKMIADQTD